MIAAKPRETGIGGRGGALKGILPISGKNALSTMELRGRHEVAEMMLSLGGIA